jgi:uncharacterized repeat protein (TIGR02543 family)/prepilin-type N-terminal cleavage/methylation domain-containing protein
LIKTPGEEGDRMTYIRKKHGFTLVEIIISIAIMGIVLMTIFSFYNFGSNTFIRGKDEYAAQSTARLANDYIFDQLRLATTASLSNSNPGTLDDDYSYFYVTGGQLYHYKWTGTMHELRTIADSIQSISFGGSSDNLVVSITVKNNKQVYNSESNLALPNLKINPNQSITGTGISIKYSKSEEFAYSGDSSSSQPLSSGINNPPIGRVLMSYSHQFSASGGVAPYSFSLADGSLPSGLYLNVNGSLSGMPTGAGINTFKVTVIDSELNTDTREFSITITDLCKVTFNKNASSASDPSFISNDVNINQAYGSLPTVTRPGKDFKGWYTAASGGIEITSTSIVTNPNDHTLYAQWQ